MHLLSLFGMKKDKANIVENSSENNKMSICQLKKNVETAEEELLTELISEAHRLFGTNSLASNKTEQFFAALEGLSSKVLGPIGYELAKMGLSCGHSGLHEVCKSKIPLPFEFLYWAGGYVHGGIAFKINRECFQTEEPRLFFETNDLPYIQDMEKLKSSVCSLGNDIRDIVVVLKNEPPCSSRIEFSVCKDSMPWGNIILQDGSVPSSIVNAPVIQLPYIGEFRCCFGEVTPDGDVVLHRDDFCMK